MKLARTFATDSSGTVDNLKVDSFAEVASGKGTTVTGLAVLDRDPFGYLASSHMASFVDGWTAPDTNGPDAK